MTKQIVEAIDTYLSKTLDAVQQLPGQLDSKWGLLARAKSLLGGRYKANNQLILPNGADPDDPGAFQCRVVLASCGPQSAIRDTFRVEIIGTLPRLDEPTEVSARITVEDIAEGADRSRAVLSRVPQHRSTNSNSFCYMSQLGTLRREVTFSDWTAVAEIPMEWLELPSKGRTTLLIRTSLVSSVSGMELATAWCSSPYLNEELGYLDAESSLRKANTLAVSLALAVSAASGELSKVQVGRLGKWAKDNILNSSEAEDAETLDKALDEAAEFFGKHHEVDYRRMCTDVAEIVPAANRCDIFEVCLEAIRARGIAGERDLRLLGYVAQWLDVDMVKAQMMVDEMLPATMREVEDPRAALGISEQMSSEQIRRRLNEQYRKWHCRVTSSDAAVREQAESMLKLIADVRSNYLVKAGQESVEEGEPVKQQCGSEG